MLIAVEVALLAAQAMGHDMDDEREDDSSDAGYNTDSGTK